MGKINEYIKDVIKEMRKVSWPGRNDLLNNTLITLLASLAVSLFIYGADWVISRLLEFIY